MEQEKKKRSGSIGIVRKEMTNELTTIQMITQKHPQLTAEQVSMALCYLLKHKRVEREQVERPTGFGRRKVWAYRLSSKLSSSPGHGVSPSA